MEEDGRLVVLAAFKQTFFKQKQQDDLERAKAEALALAKL
jgi:hypothetical protein